MKLSASDVASIVDGVVDGDKKSTITKLSKIENGDKNSLSFLGNPKYNEYLYSSNASIIIVSKNLETKKEINSTLIRVQDPNLAFSQLLEYFETQKDDDKGISKNAEINKSSKLGSDIYIGSYSVVEANVEIGDNTKVGPSVSIGKNVKIGKNCKIFSNVNIYDNSEIGNNCIIHSGTVIGSDGFGFNKNKNGENLKVIHSGNVVIEDDVEIGSNCSIDRATLGSTKIMNGVKIDNIWKATDGLKVADKHCGKYGKRAYIVGHSGYVGVYDCVKQSISGNKNYVTLTLYGEENEALPYAEKHCNKFGRSATYKSKEKYKVIFDCIE